MDISKRLLAPIYKSGPSNPIIDIDAFVKRFILFDHYIIDSTRLLEIPKIIEAFTFNGFITLVESGIISISCLPTNPASLSPSLFMEETTPGKIRPPFNYSLVLLSFAEPIQQINEFVNQIMPECKISGRQIMHLRKAIYSVTKRQLDDTDESPIQTSINEIVTTPNLLAQMCSILAKKQFGSSKNFSKIEIYPEKLAPNEIRIRSNLEKDYSISQLNAHKIIESGILAISKRNHRINIMKQFECLTGFSEEDLPIFGEKLDFLATFLNPNNYEKQFQRIVEIKGLPFYQPDLNITINAKELVKLHESSECVQFRQWLSSSNELTDEEISKFGTSISNRIGSLIRTDLGRTLRFLINTGIGLIPGFQIPSLGLSAIDEFIVERIFPISGPISFIDNLYPSIFERK